MSDIPRTIRVTSFVTVYDSDALARASALRAASDGLTPEQWAEMRATDPVRTDVQVMLDPGTSPPGCQIEAFESEDATI